jgi:hypothetical protein
MEANAILGGNLGNQNNQTLAMQSNDNPSSIINSPVPKGKESILDGKPKTPGDKYKFVKGRENWKEYLDLPVTTDKNRKLKDIIYQVSKETGIKPEVLFTSVMEEGLQTKRKGNAITFEKDEKGEYIDSYNAIGLDNVSQDLDKLSKEGYLKRDVSYQPFKRKNELGQDVNPAFFDTLEDALFAKAAYLNKNRDAVKKYASDNKLNLGDDAIDFLSMQAYNAGQGILGKAVDKYRKQGILEKDGFLEKEPVGGYAENPSYYNTRRRYDNIRYLRDLGSFSDFKK